MSNNFKFWIDPYGSIKGINKFKSGTPILVVLDPFAVSTAQGEEIDFSTVDNSFYSVKMWVMNRVFIYVSEDGKNWERNFGSFEGVLSEPLVRINPKGVKFRQPIYLKTQTKYYIRFNTLPPKVKFVNSQCSKFKVKIPLQIEKPNVDFIMRPYPEKTWAETKKKFEKDNIYLLKIPAKEIQYKEDTKKLSPWESIIYQYSGGFQIYHNLEKRGELFSDKFKELRNEIRNKLSEKPLAVLRKEKVENKIEFDILKFLPVGDTDCFAYGMTTDVAQVLNEEMSPNLESELKLFKLKEKTKPTNKIFMKFNSQKEYKLRKYMTNRCKGKEIEDKELIKLVREFLDKDTEFNKIEVEMILKNFHVCEADSLEECTLFALCNALEVWRVSLSSYHLDLSTDKKFNNSYIISAKSVGFGTGSDAFSEAETPKHVYYQIKDWWDNMFQYQKDEMQHEVGEISVIGYSSTKTRDEADNERLRLDRAWKTAVALSEVLKDGKINLFGPNPRPPKEELRYQKDFKGIVRSIHYRAADKGDYPKRHLFKDIGTFVQDIVLESDIEERQTRGNQNDDAEDRISLILFKKPIPDEVNQIVKQVIITNTAFPIHRYTNIYWYPSEQDKKKALIYVCPGQFIN